MTQGHKINTVTQKNDRGKICSSFKKFQSECLKREKKGGRKWLLYTQRIKFQPEKRKKTSEIKLHLMA